MLQKVYQINKKIDLLACLPKERLALQQIRGLPFFSFFNVFFQTWQSSRPK
jgi:hypothetical protein